MPSIINPEEENPKFDIWSSDSIYVWENWTMEFVSYEAGKDLQRSPNPGYLKIGSNAKTSESISFLKLHAKFYLCEHFSGEGGYIRFLMRSITS